MPQTRPDRIGKYRIDSTLGEGAMGVVYQGFDPDIDRVVAVKTVHAHLLTDQERSAWLDRFAREAKAAGRCLHANLVTVFDYLEVEGAPYLVMEYLEAETLADRIARGPLPTLAECGSIMGQMLSGLGAIHAAGIVHRDVKPANVMLLPDGRIKLTDFGVARFEALGATHGGMIGTPSYMSPEQFLGHKLDERADVFAAGVILFELLTGQKPYASDAIGALSQAVLQGNHKKARDISPEVPEALDEVIAGALVPELAERFASADAFKAALAAALSAPEARAAEAMERTVIVPPEPVAAAALSSTLRDLLPPTVFSRVEAELVAEIGPIGRLMVKKAASSTNDVERLIEQLAAEITNAGDRDKFCARLRKMLAETSMASPGRIAPEVQARLVGELTPHLGPIARVLVKRLSAEMATEEDLCQTLATHIDCEKARQTFLSRQGV